MIQNETIVSIATPNGEGAIGIVRLSGVRAIAIADAIFQGKNLTKVDGNTVHYGKITTEDGAILDECLALVFRSPRSYTMEDIVEFSCHGSPYILQEVVRLLIRKGAVHAKPGEFTQRAYLHGQLDLTQAEAVADLIASQSKAQHEMAIQQLRGGYSKKFTELRDKLIHFASLIELENDFGEEDVEFANREDLQHLLQDILTHVRHLIKSFRYGNALKKGVPVVIAGAPNVGKSTLLNKIISEEKAIVSEIPGTTRDFIEDTFVIEGIEFRFIDTAGIRKTEDTVEKLGIDRSIQQMEKAAIILYMVAYSQNLDSIIEEIRAAAIPEGSQVILVINKADLENTCSLYDIEEAVSTHFHRTETIAISAKTGFHIDRLLNTLVAKVVDKSSQFNVMLNNSRHLGIMKTTETSLEHALTGLRSNYASDLVALDLRHAIHHISELTGEISTDDLLESIFRDFCIGK